MSLRCIVSPRRRVKVLNHRVPVYFSSCIDCVGKPLRDPLKRCRASRVGVAALHSLRTLNYLSPDDVATPAYSLSDDHATSSQTGIDAVSESPVFLGCRRIKLPATYGAWGTQQDSHVLCLLQCYRCSPRYLVCAFLGFAAFMTVKSCDTWTCLSYGRICRADSEECSTYHKRHFGSSRHR